MSIVQDGRENVIHHKAAYPGVWKKKHLYNFIELKYLLFQLELINNYLMKMDNKIKDRCQMAVSPKLEDYPSIAYQFALPIGSPYAEIFSKYMNLRAIFIVKRLHFITLKQW